MRKTSYALFWTRRSQLLPFHLRSQAQDKICAAARTGERIRFFFSNETVAGRQPSQLSTPFPSVALSSGKNRGKG
jgi:hypothetical protein